MIRPPHIQHLNDISLDEGSALRPSLHPTNSQILSSPNLDSFVVHAQLFEVESIDGIETARHRRCSKSIDNERRRFDGNLPNWSCLILNSSSLDLRPAEDHFPAERAENVRGAV